MAKRRINWRRAALAAVAVVALVGAAFTAYSIHRYARNREIDALLLRVCGEDRAAHDAALEECSRLRSAADVRYMARLLADGSIDTRHIVPALASIGEPAFEPVVRAVGYPSDGRSFTTWLLPAFVKKWLNDRQSRIRKEKEVAVERAAHFFRAVGRTSQPYLLACLSRRSRDTRRLAARMLYRMFSADGSSEDVIPLISVRSVVPLLADPDIAIVATAASILASQPEDAGPEAILAMLEHPDSSVAATGFRALLTAGRNGDLESWVTPDIRANVITATAVAAPHRASALRVLSYFSDAKSAEVLSAALDNAERSMDLNAAYALHMRGDARGRAWLLKSYGNDSDLTRRRHAWLGLVGRPDSEIVDILLDTFDEGGPNYAMDAATVSLERGNAAPADVARLRAAFAERLFGADEAKRRAVMICLGPRREKNLREALGDDIFTEVSRLWKQDLQSPDPQVRREAWRYIERGRPPDIEELIWDMLAVEEDEYVRAALYNSLFELTKRQIRARHGRENGYE